MILDDKDIERLASELLKGKRRLPNYNEVIEPTELAVLSKLSSMGEGEKLAQKLFRIYYPFSNDSLAYNPRWEDLLESERCKFRNMANLLNSIYQADKALAVEQARKEERERIFAEINKHIDYGEVNEPIILIGGYGNCTNLNPTGEYADWWKALQEDK